MLRAAYLPMFCWSLFWSLIFYLIYFCFHFSSISPGNACNFLMQKQCLWFLRWNKHKRLLMLVFMWKNHILWKFTPGIFVVAHAKVFVQNHSMWYMFIAWDVVIGVYVASLFLNVYVTFNKLNALLSCWILSADLHDVTEQPQAVKRIPCGLFY